MHVHRIPRRIAVLTLTLATVASVVLPTAGSAHPGHGAATANPALLAALVAVGGGASDFSAKTFRLRLGGSAEETKLKAALGAASIGRFDDTFTFVVRDALATMKKNGRTLPAPAPLASKTKAVAVALYRAGVDDGTFDVEHLFDTLFSQDVHVHAMMAVGQKYGGAGETAYHQVFGKLVLDLGGPGKGGDIMPDPMHHIDGMKGMDMKGMAMPAPSPSGKPR